MSVDADIMFDYKQCLMRFNSASQYFEDGSKRPNDPIAMEPFHRLHEVMKDAKQTWTIEDENGISVGSLLSTQPVVNLRSLYLGACQKAKLDNALSYTHKPEPNTQKKQTTFGLADKLMALIAR